MLKTTLKVLCLAFSTAEATQLTSRENKEIMTDFSLAQIDTEVTVEDHPCLKVRSLNYRVEMIHPLLGKPFANQHAVFTIEDATPCTSYWDQDLALYVVFSSPEEKNQTYKFDQQDL